MTQVRFVYTPSNRMSYTLLLPWSMISETSQFWLLGMGRSLEPQICRRKLR